jgi:DNA-binding NtrC family response regulator
VVDDHRSARESMAEILRQSGHTVDAISSGVEALGQLEQASYDVIITDLKMPGMTGLELIERLTQRRHGAQILMVTAHATVQSAVEAMRHGAFDYIQKPFTAESLEKFVARAIQHGKLLDQRRKLTDASDAPVMIGDSRPMQELRARIAQVASTSETILISGESGTGKELVAHTIHTSSRRRESPLVSLNCPVLSAHLMESELFGHERGAFTGADRARVGRFELADRGTILLDEVTEIDLGLQAKLLRVLQEQSFERVGSSETQQVDVRVLATTNRDLQTEINEGRFRQDLYYRLAVVPITIPPLRERLDDVPALVDLFLHAAAERIGKPPCQIEPDAMRLLGEYHWPGNVRELSNIISRAVVLNGGQPVRADEIRPWLLQTDPQPTSGSDVPVGLSLHEMERQLIEATLDQFGGHRAKTADALGIGVRTLSGKLKSYGYAPRTKEFSKAA